MEGMDVDCTVDVYCDWHRHFMQVLLSRPVLAPDEVTKVVIKICGEDAIRGDNAQRQLKTFLKTVQEKIQLLGLDLRKGNSEITGKPVYALINTSAGDEVAVKKETSQLRFLRAVIQEVVTSTRGDISQMAALNLADGLPGISKTEAQTLLSQLVCDFWLESTDSRVALHTRLILELEPYLVQHYPDYVPRCRLCSKITVRGRYCDRDGCEAKYHRHCLRKMQKQLGAVKCQACNNEIQEEEER